MISSLKNTELLPITIDAVHRAVESVRYVHRIIDLPTIGPWLALLPHETLLEDVNPVSLLVCCFPSKYRWTTEAELANAVLGITIPSTSAPNAASRFAPLIGS